MLLSLFSWYCSLFSAKMLEAQMQNFAYVFAYFRIGFATIAGPFGFAGSSGSRGCSGSSSNVHHSSSFPWKGDENWRR